MEQIVFWQQIKRLQLTFLLAMNLKKDTTPLDKPKKQIDTMPHKDVDLLLSI